MKGKTLFNLLALGLVLILGALLIGLPALVDAQGPEPQATPIPLDTAFTYQGRLADGGSPANGTYDFQFKLEDGAGTQVGSPVTKNDVTVTDGLFTVQLDFGWGVFTGDARYLEIGVRPGSSTGAYTTLSPRQPLTAAPYALYSLNADLVDAQHASAFAPASHDHLGQTWTGNNNPLVITGTFGEPDYAALVLGNSYYGDGLRVESPGEDGVHVQSPGEDGVYVELAGDDGVQVTSAGDYAGMFYGDVAVSGNLSKGGGSFKIDHPLDPENQYLYFSAILTLPIS